MKFLFRFAKVTFSSIIMTATLSSEADSLNRLALLADGREKVQQATERARENPCDRPAVYEFLRMATDPSATELCPKMMVLDQRAERVSLDINDLFKIQYVIVAKGEELANQFGHSALRFIFCNDRQCKNPYSYDLGFAAQSAGEPFSAYEGLVGGYSSALFFNNSFDFERQKRFEELRGYEAYNLKLNEKEKTLMFYALVEYFWIASHPYRFLNNNCAAEILKVLQIAFDDHDPLQKVSTVLLTPSRLLTALQASARVTPDNSSASRKKNLDLYVKQLKLNGITKSSSLTSYWKSPAHTRKVAEGLLNIESTSQLLLLEESTLQQLVRRAKNKTLICLFSDQQQSPMIKDLAREYKKALKDLLPANLRLIRGDTVPHPEQIISDLEIETRRSTLSSLQKQVWANCSSVPEINYFVEEIAETQSNISWLKNYLVNKIYFYKQTNKEIM